MKHRLVIAAAVSALLINACDNSTRPGGGGTVNAVVVSPNGDEGAAVLDVVGTVESFTGTEGVSVYTTATTTGTRVVLVRLTPGTLSMKLALQDQDRLPAISVIEVADADDRVRPSIAGYAVELK